MASVTARMSSSRIPSVKRIPIANSMAEQLIPAAFRCPISLDLMKDPVTLHTGITYDRRSIEAWLELGNLTCPVTKQALENEDLVPNHSIRRMIQDWCVANRCLGIERIPTPRIPVTPTQVSDLLSEISVACRRGDNARCRELARMIKALGRESERNRRCIISGGAGRVLSNCFSELAAESLENPRAGVMDEILAALAAFLPLDEGSYLQFASPKPLDSIVSVLKSADLEGRLNATLVLKELASSSTPDRIEVVARTDGLIEALVKLIEKPISPRATNASMVTAFFLVASSERIAARFVEMGIVPLLLEILVDSEKSMCEKALGVLDGVLSCSRGREMASAHSLAVPVLVKKTSRVADMETEFAVSALWKLCKNDDEGERVVEALQAGAFQKLLLLLQVGCKGTTKEKVSDLLKLLNRKKRSSECIETVDLRGLKRSF
ncbi:U-box domain-containing protein 21-like [Musa acuminata AAA Group]|uniref:U-box domain-containing protein 21-like n=1 Tax=Musa acuminata AAA Group TaxID=214697 RepID=UPI0031D689C2